MSIALDQRPTWVEVDLGGFDRNVEAIARRLPAGSRLIAVLKANAYGHGAVELAKRCKPANVAMIAIAMLEEALELRRAGIDLPLLILGPLTETQITIAIENAVTVGVVSPEELQAVCRIARQRDVVIHLKLDSGMGRMGLIERDLPAAVEMIRSAPRLRIDALYTHFANASNPNDPYTEEQIACARTCGAPASMRHSTTWRTAPRPCAEWSGRAITSALALPCSERRRSMPARRDSSPSFAGAQRSRGSRRCRREASSDTERHFAPPGRAASPRFRWATLTDMPDCCQTMPMFCCVDGAPRWSAACRWI